MNTVGSHIRKLRKQRGLSQQALAEKLNVTRQAVSQWENGNTQPDLDTLARIAKAFDVDILEVIYGEKRKAPPHLTPQQRKRHRIGFIVFGALSLAVGALSLILKPHLYDWYFRYENTALLVAYCYYIEPLLYISIPLAALNGCSLVWDIRIRHRMVRRIVLIASAAYILLYCGIATASLVFRSSTIAFFFGFMAFTVQNSVLFLLPGIGLFFGLNGRRTETDTKEKQIKRN
jgi:Predicted transcriptional regulators